ncbi:hypothetical protein M427DRAFT_60960 [Gonapodya prolifera JEL478]|uniref:Tcp11-domain-containing protein n=1 Tax=Gonapodya prolifera (strain JEL478) TaxID=1344416 RepID=A0A139A3W5_GONPJ|nr:hypothetical protein M427DRAFT_60960 [Gonapodya prolifera JEL478]|eukprot:KXS11155.1 hypothetical protein M427DRAFT_60960 [Gonapodya prolifera JEL478]
MMGLPELQSRRGSGSLIESLDLATPLVLRASRTKFRDRLRRGFVPYTLDALRHSKRRGLERPELPNWSTHTCEARTTSTSSCLHHQATLFNEPTSPSCRLTFSENPTWHHVHDSSSISHSFANTSNASSGAGYDWTAPNCSLCSAIHPYVTNPTPDTPVPAAVLPFLPPISRFTLRELDLARVQANLQLRHDLYFDPHLHYQPTVRDAAAQRRYEGYWDQVTATLSKSPWLLSLIVNECHCILREIVPPAAIPAIDEFFDDARVAPKNAAGFLDCQAVVAGVCQLLKVHCAPARDAAVEALKEEGKEKKWGTFFRHLFELLEIMKLDLANHHVRLLRPHVLTALQTTEWSWFQQQLTSGRIKLTNTTRWLRAAWRLYAAKNTTPRTSAVGSTEFLHFAFLHLVGGDPSSSSDSGPCHRTSTAIPETCAFDTARLSALQREWNELTGAACVTLVFRQLANVNGTVPDEKMDEFRRTLADLVKGGTTTHHLAVHIATFLQQPQHSEDGGSDPKTPDDTLVNTARTLLTQHLQLSSPVFRRVHSLIGSAVLDVMEGNVPDPETMRTGGLVGFEPQVVELGRRMLCVADLNRRTYAGGVYAGVVKDFFLGDDGDDGVEGSSLQAR